MRNEIAHRRIAPGFWLVCVNVGFRHISSKFTTSQRDSAAEHRQVRSVSLNRPSASLAKGGRSLAGPVLERAGEIRRRGEAKRVAKRGKSASAFRSAAAGPQRSPGRAAGPRRSARSSGCRPASDGSASPQARGHIPRRPCRFGSRVRGARHVTRGQPRRGIGLLGLGLGDIDLPFQPDAEQAQMVMRRAFGARFAAFQLALDIVDQSGKFRLRPDIADAQVIGLRRQR